MPDITRPIRRPNAAGQKVLILRQPAKSVHASDHPDPTPIRLSLGLIIAVGAVAVTWLIGHLGYRLGYAAAIGVPELLAEPGQGLVTGAMILIDAPRALITAGITDPVRLMVGFLLIAMPAGALAAARPRTPGGPPATPLSITMSSIGAALVGIAAITIVAWTVAPWRTGLLGDLPASAGDAAAWADGLAAVAGYDTLVVAAAAVWMVLAFRLPIPRWLRSLLVPACVFALVLATLAFATSGAAASHARAGRSVVINDAGETALVLGYTRRHAVLLRAMNGTPVLSLDDTPFDVPVVSSESIVAFLEDAASE